MRQSDAPSSGPLISIIVPAFNAADTLGETLASAAAQSHRNIEILIVDDGSTDTTARIANAFCAGDPRARLLSQPNGGVAAARNHGIEAAIGEYIAPLDADDIWHPDKLARQIAAAAATGAAFVSCWFRDIDMAGRVWRDGPRPRHGGAVHLRMIADNFVGNGSALLVRREAALAAGGYDRALRDSGLQGCEDLLFQLNLAARFSGAIVPSYLVGYRTRAGAMSADPLAMFQSWLEVRRRARGTRIGARTAWRWAAARQRLHLAESFLHRGRWSDAVWPFVTGFAGDPRRAVLAVSHWIARRRSKSRRPASRPLFAGVDPDHPVFPATGDALFRLDARRETILGSLESSGT